MINIVLCIHDKDGTYYHNAIVTMTSICLHTQAALQFHIFHDATLRQQARDELETLAKRLDQAIVFKKIELPLSLTQHNYGHFTPAAVFRMWIPDLLGDCDHVIYLDCDVVFNQLDIVELLKAGNNDYPISAVIDPFCMIVDPCPAEIKQLNLDPKKYINSGVLIFRPKKIKNLFKDFLNFSENTVNQSHFDQNFLNIFFKDNIDYLPEKFNYQITITQGRLYDEPCLLSGKILHFTGKTKPTQGYLTPAYTCFWRYTTFVSDSNALVAGKETRYLQKIPERSNSAKIIGIKPKNDSQIKKPKIQKDSRYQEWFLGDESADVPGYLHTIQAIALMALLKKQDELMIKGSLAEIGVFHGKTYIGLCRAAREGEKIVAVDPFRLGKNDFFPQFTQHLDKYLTSEEKSRTQILRKLSTDLDSQQWISALEKPARFVHLDGHHSREAILNDVVLANSFFAKEGVLVFDDFLNELHPGLTTGIIDALKAHPWLVPIAVVPRRGTIDEGGSKLVCCHPAYAERYLQALDEALPLRADTDHLFEHKIRVYRTA